VLISSQTLIPKSIVLFRIPNALLFFGLYQTKKTKERKREKSLNLQNDVDQVPHIKQKLKRYEININKRVG